MTKAPEGYFVEPTGELWQSVFPRAQAEFSQLHSSVADALAYFQEVTPGVTPVVLKDTLADDIN